VSGLRVGLMQSVGTKILPGILTRFTAERPQVEFVLHEAHDANDLLAMVESHDLDLAFGANLHPDGPFTTRGVLEDPFRGAGSVSGGGAVAAPPSGL
jgi:DNA-binding transcriptional LysR family regulator